MSDNDSFEDFQRRYQSCADFVEKRDLLVAHIDAAESWPAEPCMEWIAGLSNWPEDWVEGIDPEPVGDPSGKFEHGLYALRDEVDSLSIDLAQALIDRLRVLRAPLPLDRMAPLIEGLARRDGALDLPRPELMDLHERWIGAGFVPGLVTYRRHVAERATAEEVVEIVERLIESSGQPRDYVAEWVDLALDRAMHARPDVLPRWLDVLREQLTEEPDPFVQALADRIQGWLDRARGRAGLPAAFDKYVTMRSVSPQAVERATKALDAMSPQESWTVHTRDLRPILERDAELAQPRMKDHLACACPESTEALVAYCQLRRLSSASCLLACDLLTLAVYRQLLSVVRRLFLDVEVVLGLGELINLIDGGAPLGGGDLAMETPSREIVDVLKLVRRCNKVRNKIHHPESALEDRDRRELERLILDHDGPQLLTKIANLHLRRRA